MLCLFIKNIQMIPSGNFHAFTCSDHVANSAFPNSRWSRPVIPIAKQCRTKLPKLHTNVVKG